MGVQQSADLTPILVAVVGAVATVTAAALALRQRRTDTGEETPEVVAQWHDLVDTMKGERDRAIGRAERADRERDRAERKAEDAFAARDAALIELRACKLHDHGGVT